MSKLILRCNGCGQPAKAQLVAGKCESCEVARVVKVCGGHRRFEQIGDAWYSTDVRTNSGHGRHDEAEALAHHHRLIGFEALKKLGYNDSDTHDFDWHLWPTDSALAFVQRGIAEWSEVTEARATVNPFHALVAAMVAQS